MSWLISSAVRFRRLVVAGVVAVLALGLVQLRQANVDVYPEFESTAVQIQTEALGLSALEVEQLITVPLEQNLLNGIPRLDEIRSRSMPGLSVIDLAFEPGTELYLARQLVQERMTRVALLPKVGTPPSMIQPTASTSRVAMVGLRSDDVSLIDMSVLAQWHMRPRLLSIPGVAAVSIWGLRDRQLQVQVDPARLTAQHVTLTELITTTGNALWVSPLSFVQASTPGTGGFLESPSQRIGVQHISPITDASQLADVSVERTGAPPVRLGDVADVGEDHQPLIGDAGSAGTQGLMLVVERFPDADTAQVGRDVEEALDAMAPGLSGITVDPTVYQPARYLDSALGRLGLAVLIGLVLMLAVILVVAFSWRVALIAFGSVALSLVAALWVLHLRGGTLTAMTVVGLATVMALVVDDAVGDVAQMRERFDRSRGEGRSAAAAVATGAIGARRAGLTYATAIVLIALAPLLLLGGTVGAFARPALVTFALAALISLVVALVVTPTLAVVLLGGQATRPDWSPPFTRWVRRGTGRLAPSVGRRTPAVLALVVLAALAAVGVAQLRSGDVLPQAEDRNVMVRLEAAPGTSLTEMDRITDLAAAELRTLTGVEAAGSHVGRAVGADTIANVDASEIWLTVGADADYGDTLEAIRATIRGYAGLHSEVGTYGAAQLAAAEDSTGDDVVVRVFGQDYDTIRETADMVRESVASVDGVISPVVEVLPRQPVAEIRLDLAAAQRFGVKPGDVRRAANTMISGLVVGSLYEQQAIFNVVVWGDPGARQSVDDIEALLIDTPSGEQVPLGEVADVVQTSDPTTISHHAVSRSLDITAQVADGRNHADVAADVAARLQQLNYPYEYRAEVVSDGGDAGLRQTLLAGLLVVAVVVFLLLQAATGSWRGALVLFVCVPLAGVGGLLAAQLFDGVASLAVLAAIFAAVALTVRQALVLVRRAHALGSRRGPGFGPEAMRSAVEEQAPALLASVLVAAAAFLPAAVMGGGAGLELLRPFAVTLLAGLLSSAVVVVFLIPALYPAVGALAPSDGESDDPYAGRHERRGDGEPVNIPHQAGRPDIENEPAGAPPEGGRVMRTSRSAGIASLFLAAGVALTGCQTPAQGSDTEPAEEPAAVEEAADGGPSRITLSAKAEERLGLETTAVASKGSGSVIPYGGVVYDNEGGAWTFALVGDHTYQRAAITVDEIVGDDALLTAGPAVGTEVVTVAAAELVGVEAGISGEE